MLPARVIAVQVIMGGVSIFPKTVANRPKPHRTVPNRAGGLKSAPRTAQLTVVTLYIGDTLNGEAAHLYPMEYLEWERPNSSGRFTAFTVKEIREIASKHQMSDSTKTGDKEANNKKHDRQSP